MTLPTIMPAANTKIKPINIIITIRLNILYKYRKNIIIRYASLVFFKKRKLSYQCRIDVMENPAKMSVSQDARNAIEALLAAQNIPVTSTKVFGCSVKWAEKKEVVQRVYDKWANEPVNVEMIATIASSDILNKFVLYI